MESVFVFYSIGVNQDMFHLDDEIHFLTYNLMSPRMQILKEILSYDIGELFIL